MEHRWIDETQPEEAPTVNFFRCGGCGLIKRTNRFTARPVGAKSQYFMITSNAFRYSQEGGGIVMKGNLEHSPPTIRDAHPDEVENCGG